MAIKIGISNKVGVKVQGHFNDENGVKQPFDFKLTCKRLKEAEFTKKMEDGDATIADFIEEITEGWEGVRDANNVKVDYSPEALRELFETPGIASLIFDTYRREVGVKAKN